VAERERRKIASDLHDRIGQSLFAVQLKLAGTRKMTRGKGAAAVEESIQILSQAITDARSLSFELSPPILYDLGLPAAVHWLAEQMFKEHGLRVEVLVDRKRRPAIDDKVAALLFRFVRELLLNVVKHAETNDAQVAIRSPRRRLRIEVSDRGRGFDPTTGQAGFGLFAVRENVFRLGGTFALDSAPGKGARAIISMPLGKTS
jgi:signal transduction histidine kinase